MASDTSTRFLDLPPELRDNIYELVALKPQNTITMLLNAQSEVSARRPALACVNRQIRKEVLPIFYGQNVFQAELTDEEDVACALRWLDHIRDENVARLKKLTLCGWIKVTVEGDWGEDYVRRWVKAELDLGKGTLELSNDKSDWFESQPPHPQVLDAINELRLAFEDMTKAKKGQAWDGYRVGVFMIAFHTLCTFTDFSSERSI